MRGIEDPTKDTCSDSASVGRIPVLQLRSKIALTKCGFETPNSGLEQARGNCVNVEIGYTDW
jgi:hypothetical protein